MTIDKLMGRTPGLVGAGWDECMASLDGRTIIDVGANTGDFTAVFLNHGAHVIAIEPGPKLAEGLRTRFAGDSRVVVRQVGLSDAPGRLEGVQFHNCWTLAKPGQFATKRIGSVSPGAAEIEGDGTFDVDLTTLDAVVEGDVGFVKIDADGYEPNILRGATRTLTAIRPPMLIELSYVPQDMGESIEEFIAGIYRAGYVLATLDGYRTTETQVLEHFPWHTSLDMLMMPVERARHWPEIIP